MITTEVGGKLSQWYNDVGAMVEQGEVVAEIETNGFRISVRAPASGRLTEMLALPGDNIEAGSVIGWIDALENTEESPQPLSALIRQPAPVERKLKPRRKAHASLRLSPRFWMVLSLLLAMGVGAVMALSVALPIRNQTVQVVATVPVTIMATPPPLVPTPRYRLQERVLLREPIGEIQRSMQGVVQEIGYEMGNGTWYKVKFGDNVVRVPEAQLDPIGILAPTPTMRYDFRDWNWSYPLMLSEPVADFPAGTRVRIGSALFNGIEWELDVVTENGVALHVREVQLAAPPDAPANPAVTPTLVFSQ